MEAQPWAKRMSRSRGVPYYYHTLTGASVWDRPDEYDSDADAGLPGDAQQRERANVYQGGEEAAEAGAGAAGGSSSQADAPREVQVLHLLLKHSGSRNPVSRRTNAATTMSPEEAVTELREFEQQILAAPAFSEQRVELFRKLAKERSDCSSYKQGGDLGMFGRRQMQKSFEDASFALGIKEMSGIVHSDSGVHLILRVA